MIVAFALEALLQRTANRASGVFDSEARAYHGGCRVGSGKRIGIVWRTCSLYSMAAVVVVAFGCGRKSDRAADTGVAHGDVGVDAAPAFGGAAFGWLPIAAGLVLLWFLAAVVVERASESISARSCSRPEDGRVAAWRRLVLIVLRSLIGLVAFVWILSEVGLPGWSVVAAPCVLLLGLAIVARGLLADGLHAFGVLSDAAFDVDDVVEVGNTKGIVDRVTPRSVVVRDFDGAVHHVPHATIGAVTNYSRSWSRATVDVEVEYDEDLDRVLEILRGEVDALRRDAEVGELLGDEQLVGVDRFERAGAVLRVGVKTAPLREVRVQERLEAGIRTRLDENGLAAAVRGHAGAVDDRGN